MHRSILTAVFVFTLSVGATGLARADDAAPPVVTPAVASTQAEPGASMPKTDPSSTHVDAPVTPPADGAETAPPTAGADLAMWNVPEPAAAAADSAKPAKTLSPLRRFASGIVSRSSAIASSLTRSAMRFIGVPYVFGGTRTSGFDCSGYVQHVFRMNGVHLPRTADAQFDAARHIRSKMVPGDLVFFHTYAPGVSHVGIYLGHDKFIHASSSRGVAVSSLHDHYWAPRYLGAKRVLGS